jgi:hypothetical protein
MDLDVSRFRKPLNVQLKGKNVSRTFARDCESILEGIYCMLMFKFITEEEARDLVVLLVDKIDGVVEKGDSEDRHIALS